LLGTNDDKSLQNLDTTLLPDGSLCWVNDQLAVYALHKTSTAAPAGVTIVQPGSGPGRWMPLISVTSGGATIVADVATLAALPAPVDGAQAFVLSVRSLWAFATGSALTADGISVVNDTGLTGQWLRDPIPSLSWAYQADWGINATTGDDENLGTAASPLATLAELRRRLDGQTLMQRTVVRQFGDVEEDLLLTVTMRNPSDPFVYMSDPSTWTTVATGSITGVLAINRTANPPNAQEITDGTVADWTPYLGMRIRLVAPSARAGATAFIMKNMGANTARTTRFNGVGFDPATAISVQLAVTDPVIGDPYVIETLPGIDNVDLTVNRASVDNSGLKPRAFFDSLEPGQRFPTTPTLGRCLVRSPDAFGGGIASITRCRTHLQNSGTGGSTFAAGTLWVNGFFWYGGSIAAGGAFKGTSAASGIQSATNSQCNLRNDFLLQGVNLQGHFLRTDLVGFSVWDTPGTMIELFGNSVLECFAKVYGSGGGDQGIQCESGAMVRYGDATLVPNIHGVTDVDIANAAYTWDEIAAMQDGCLWDYRHDTGVLRRLSGEPPAGLNQQQQGRIYTTAIAADVPASSLFPSAYALTALQGLFEVYIYLAVTTDGAPGDTVTLQLAWTDDRGARTLNILNAVAVDAGGYFIAQTLIETNGVANPTYTLTYTKAGAPQVSLRIQTQQVQ
jgi:hypothetical protein